MQGGSEHRRPPRPRRHQPLGEGLGEVARGEGVHPQGQMRPVLLERAHGEQDHGAVAVERVERRRGHLFEEVDGQKLLPWVEAR